MTLLVTPYFYGILPVLFWYMVVFDFACLGVQVAVSEIDVCTLDQI